MTNTFWEAISSTPEQRNEESYQAKPSDFHSLPWTSEEYAKVNRPTLQTVPCDGFIDYDEACKPVRPEQYVKAIGYPANHDTFAKHDIRNGHPTGYVTISFDGGEL